MSTSPEESEALCGNAVGVKSLGRALCQHVGVQQHSESPADAVLVADASQRGGVFGRGLKATNSHGSTPSWAFASLSTPSDRSATASIPYFWGFGSSGTVEDVAAARRARARDDIVRLVHRTSGVHRLARDMTRVLERAVPFDGASLLTLDPRDPASHQRRRRERPR